jgi:hypothetical protein
MLNLHNYCPLKQGMLPEITQSHNQQKVAVKPLFLHPVMREEKK